MAEKKGKMIRLDDATYATLKGRAKTESTSIAEVGAQGCAGHNRIGS